jgi:hypothetical protein
MPRSLCLIGNSHLVALQLALAQDPARARGWSLSFHGFRGRTVLDTAIRDGALHPLTPRAEAEMRRYSGQAPIPLDRHQAFALVGLNVKLFPALTLWKSARWPDLPGLDAIPDLAAMPPALISTPAAEAALTADLSRLAGLVMAGRLRRAGLGPVFVLPQPHLHRRALWTDLARFYGIGRALKAGDGAALAALWARALTRAAKAAGATALPQPPETVTAHLMTHPAFMADDWSGPENGREDGRDHAHANAAHGALLLDRLLTAAEARLPPAAAGAAA